MADKNNGSSQNHHILKLQKVEQGISLKEVSHRINRVAPGIPALQGSTFEFKTRGTRFGTAGAVLKLQRVVRRISLKNASHRTNCTAPGVLLNRRSDDARGVSAKRTFGNGFFVLPVSGGRP